MTGIYDQLAKLDTQQPKAAKTPTVASPEPSKTAKVVEDQQIAEKGEKPAAKRRTPSPKQLKPEAIPKLPLDKPPRRQRIITRASFEIFQDQIHILRRVSLSDKLEGGDLSISEMVREALDEYLTAKNLRP